MNQITHWLDASNIYGSTVEELNELRDGRTALLKVSQNNMLPLQRRRSHDCEATDGATCFHAGEHMRKLIFTIRMYHLIIYIKIYF